MQLSEAEISKRFSVLSVIAMIAVVFIHTNTIGTLPNPSLWNQWLQEAFSRIGTSWAVPFFFLQAGYWAYKTNNKGYLPMLRKKFWGLCLPYFLWAIIGALMALPLIMFNNFVTERPLLSRTPFEMNTIMGG